MGFIIFCILSPIWFPMVIIGLSYKLSVKIVDMVYENFFIELI